LRSTPILCVLAKLGGRSALQRCKIGIDRHATVMRCQTEFASATQEAPSRAGEPFYQDHFTRYA
jgi:hypothetical protein